MVLVMQIAIGIVLGATILFLIPIVLPTIIEIVSKIFGFIGNIAIFILVLGLVGGLLYYGINQSSELLQNLLGALISIISIFFSIVVYGILVKTIRKKYPNFNNGFIKLVLFLFSFSFVVGLVSILIM